jgi:hypothetical protein
MRASSWARTTTCRARSVKRSNTALAYLSGTTGLAIPFLSHKIGM